MVFKLFRVLGVLVIVTALLALPAPALGEQPPSETADLIVQLAEPPIHLIPPNMAPAAWPSFYRQQIQEQLVSHLPELARLQDQALIGSYELLPDLNAIRLTSPQPEAVQQVALWPGIQALGQGTDARMAAAREDMARGLSRFVESSLAQGPRSDPQEREPRQSPSPEGIEDTSNVSNVYIYENESYLNGYATINTELDLVLKDSDGIFKASAFATSDSSGYFDVYFSTTILGGDTVEITPSGEPTVSIYVTPLTGTADKAADTVAGSAAPNSALTVYLRHWTGAEYEYYYTYPSTDGAGAFFTDLNPADITMGDRIQVYYTNPDGHTVRIQFYVPGFYVSPDSDRVIGQNLAPNTPVHLVLKGAGGAVKETADTTTSYSGYFSHQWVCNDVVTDITAGDSVEVTVSGEPTVSMSVPALTIAPDAASDTVSGTAPAGAKLVVGVSDNETSDAAAQTISADGNGTFLVDFTGSFDIAPAHYAWVEYHDAQDNEVSTSLYVPGLVSVDATWGGLQVSETPGVAVEAALKNALGAIKGTASGIVGQGGSLYLTFYDSEGTWVNIAHNDVVEVAIGAAPIKTIEVVPISIFADRDARRVFGYGPPNSELLVTVNNGNYSATVTTDSAGYYSADFSWMTGGYRVSVYYTDPGGNQLEYGTYAPQFTVHEMGDRDLLYGYAPANSVVVITVKDSGDLVKSTVTTNSSYDGYYSVSSEPDFNIEVGDTVEMASGPISTSLEIVSLTISGDKETDYVFGNVPPSAWLNVYARRYLAGVSESAYNYFYADSTGYYSTNFGGGYDLRGGDTLEVLYWDGGHFDRIRLYRYMPHVRTSVGTDSVGGYATAGDSGTVTVKDSGGTVKATAEVMAVAPYGSFSAGLLVDGSGSPIDIVAGDHIVVALGSLNQDVAVPALDASIDLDGDTVTMSGPPNEPLAFSAYHWRDSYYSTWTSSGSLASWVTMDGSGHGTFDCNCLADLQPGDYVWLYYLDAEDNYVYQSFTTTSPAIAVTGYPTAVQPYGLVTVQWIISDGVHSTTTTLRWDTESHALDNLYSHYGESQTGTIGTNVGYFIAPTGGTIYFKAYAYVDGTPIYSDEHSIVVSGDVATTVIDPVSGTTNDVTPVLSGISPAEADIEIYEGTTLLATGSADDTGAFAIELPNPLSYAGLARSPSGIEHPIHARAIVEGNPMPDSNMVYLTVDPSLIVDPVHVLVTARGVTQHLRDDAGYANLGGRIWLRTGDSLGLSVPISCTNVISADLYVGGLYAADMADSGDDVWVGSLMAPASGTFAISTKINCAGVVQSIDLFTGLIDPDGYVYDASVGTAQRIAGAEVTCYELVDEVNDIWQVWNGAIWGQENPQFTGADGYYSFFTLPGTYQVQVHADDYAYYVSPALVVVDEPVHHNVPLGPVYPVYLPLITRN